MSVDLSALSSVPLVHRGCLGTRCVTTVQSNANLFSKILHSTQVQRSLELSLTRKAPFPDSGGTSREEAACQLILPSRTSSMLGWLPAVPGRELELCGAPRSVDVLHRAVQPWPSRLWRYWGRPGLLLGVWRQTQLPLWGGCLSGCQAPSTRTTTL